MHEAAAPDDDDEDRGPWGRVRPALGIRASTPAFIAVDKATLNHAGGWPGIA